MLLCETLAAKLNGLLVAPGMLVNPLPLLACHCSVGACVPLAAAVNDTTVPAQTFVPSGLVVTAAAILTVRVATAEVALLLDAAGKQSVLIETVGVGQDEIDIVRLADCIVVVMVPGLGDDIQNMKAGLMEIADIFVLNKSDREGADRLEQQLHAMLQLAPEREGWRPPVVRTVATENKGIDALAKAIAEFRERFATSKQRHEKKIENWKQRLMEMLETRLVERALDGAAGEKLLAELAESVADRRTDPFSAVSEILRRSGLG